MKPCEEMSRTRFIMRCLAGMMLVFISLGIYAGLSVVRDCSQRERDIEYLRTRDFHVRFAYMVTADGGVDPDATPDGIELLNGTRLFYAFNDISTIYLARRPLSDQEVRELIPILARFRGLKEVGLLWSSPIEPQTIRALKEVLPPHCQILKLTGSAYPDEW